jgi:Heat shock protein. Metallo peptidase. MEROPS family M48B
MKRIFLFLLTNIAIIVLLSITLSLLGVEGILAANGSDLDLQALLCFLCLFLVLVVSFYFATDF